MISSTISFANETFVAMMTDEQQRIWKVLADHTESAKIWVTKEEALHIRGDDDDGLNGDARGQNANPQTGHAIHSERITIDSS